MTTVKTSTAFRYAARVISGSAEKKLRQNFKSLGMEIFD